MRLLILLACLPTAVVSQEFVALTGTEIEAALNDTTLDNETGEERTFFASGRTAYDNGQPSWGSWMVRGDAYCSERAAGERLGLLRHGPRWKRPKTHHRTRPHYCRGDP